MSEDSKILHHEHVSCERGKEGVDLEMVLLNRNFENDRKSFFARGERERSLLHTGDFPVVNLRKFPYTVQPETSIRH